MAQSLAINALLKLELTEEDATFMDEGTPSRSMNK
jgi:hypothetical protein